MSVVVVDHHRDREHGVYSFVFAEVVDTVQEAMRDDDGAVVRDADGQPVVVEHSVLGPQRSVVWDAEDERWFSGKGRARKRRDAAAIASEQREEVLAALRPPVEKARSRKREELPGVGDVIDG